MGWRERAKSVDAGSDWRSRAKPTPEQALVGAAKDRLSRLPKLPEGAGLSKEEQAGLADVPGMARSALMGLTSNAGDRIEALVDGLTQDKDAQLGWVYDNSDAIHRKYMEDVKEHPLPNVAGAVMQPSPFGKASAATTLGKIGLAGARVGYAGGSSALADYLGGEPKTQDASYLDSAKLPMAIQAGAEVAAPVLGKVAGGLRNAAGRAAVNASGLRGGIVNQAKRAGIPTLDALGREEIPKLGNEMLDEGLIPFMGSKEAILKRSNAMMDQAGTAAAASRARGDLAGSFSQGEGIQAAEARLAERIDPTKGGNLQTARAAGRAQDFLQDAAKTPDTFDAADRLKRGAYGNTNWSTEAPDASKLKRATVSGYRQSMEDQLERLVPGEGKALREANQRYGLAAKTADFAEEAAGREAANRKFGLPELMLGATAATAGSQFGGAAGGAAGAVLPLASHFIKTRGASTAAPLARLASKGSAAASGVIAKNPAAAGPLARYLSPEDEDDVSWFTGR